MELTDAVSRRYAWLISVEELKKTVATLSPGEQNELTAFLFHLRHREDVAYQSMLKARMDDKRPITLVDAGRVRKALRRRISAGGAYQVYLNMVMREIGFAGLDNR